MGNLRFKAPICLLWGTMALAAWTPLAQAADGDVPAPDATFYLFATDDTASARADVSSTVETALTVDEGVKLKRLDELLGEDPSEWDRLHEEVNDGCRAARAKLAELETETALPGMKECVRGLEKLLGLAEVREDLYKNLQSLAIAFFLNGSDSGAEKALRQALIIKPDPGALDPEMFPVKMRPILEELLLNFELDKADLEVVSDPPGAEIYLNGILMGTAPMKLEGLFFGLAYVTARLPGYGPYVERIPVYEASPDTVKIEMPPPKVDLTSELASARRAFGSEKLPGSTVSTLRRKVPVNVVILGLLTAGDGAGIRLRLCAYDLTDGSRMACRTADADTADAGEDVFEGSANELVAKMNEVSAPAEEDRKPRGPGFGKKLVKVVKSPIFLGVAGGVVGAAVAVTLLAVLIPEASVRPRGGRFVGGL